MRRLAFALAAALALALGGCGAKQDVLTTAGTKPFTVMLDWFPNADHAPLYAAIAHGDFRAVGLDVKPVVPSQTDEPLKLLAAGKVDIAISYEPELLLARDQGLKLVSVGALVQRPLTSIIALPGGHVRSVAELQGKTVGTAGIPYQAAMLKAALHGAHVNRARVHEVNVGFSLVPAMLSVTGEDHVTTTAGSYDCWVVSLATDAGQTQYWVAKTDRIVVKTSQLVPESGGLLQYTLTRISH